MPDIVTIPLSRALSASAEYVLMDLVLGGHADTAASFAEGCLRKALRGIDLEEGERGSSSIRDRQIACSLAVKAIINGGAAATAFTGGVLLTEQVARLLNKLPNCKDEARGSSSIKDRQVASSLAVKALISGGAAATGSVLLTEQNLQTVLASIMKADNGGCPLPRVVESHLLMALLTTLRCIGDLHTREQVRQEVIRQLVYPLYNSIQQVHSMLQSLPWSSPNVQQAFEGPLHRGLTRLEILIQIASACANTCEADSASRGGNRGDWNRGGDREDSQSLEADRPSGPWDNASLTPPTLACLFLALMDQLWPSLGSLVMEKEAGGRFVAPLAQSLASLMRCCPSAFYPYLSSVLQCLVACMSREGSTAASVALCTAMEMYSTSASVAQSTAMEMCSPTPIAGESGGGCAELLHAANTAVFSHPLVLDLLSSGAPDRKPDVAESVLKVCVSDSCLLSLIQRSR
eukprot:gene21908-28950_t